MKYDIVVANILLSPEHQVLLSGKIVRMQE